MISDKRPKISCVTVTTGRVDLLKMSIHCFLHQLYSPRELIVLSQGSPEVNSQIRNHVKDLKEVKFYEASPRLTLGEMRNLSIELSTGSIICQWDDDDLYHPARISSQYKALVQTGSIASLYSEHLKYFKHTGDMYWIDWFGEGGNDQRVITRKFLCGTVMFYKDFFHKHSSMLYPESGHQSRREEDLNVLEKLSKAGKLAPVREGYQYIYVYHGENTYELSHHKLVLDTGSGKVIRNREFLLKHQPLLRDVLSQVGLDEEISVRSETDIAFKYTR